jgi:hypothetical protein
MFTTIVCSHCTLHYCQCGKQTAEALLELYTEWIEKYPITAVTEPFGPTDELLGTALMERGDALLATTHAKALQEVSVPVLAVSHLVQCVSCMCYDYVTYIAVSYNEDKVLALTWRCQAGQRQLP